MASRETRRLTIIPKPDEGTRTVLFLPPGEESPIVSGEGPMAYTCGACDVTIVDGVDAGALKNLVFICRGCGAYNQTLE